MESLPYQPHSRTSRRAADKAAGGAVSWRRRVLDALVRAGEYGATDEELQTSLELNPSTQRPRRIELMDCGLIKASGRTRRTRSGREAVVWVAVKQLEMKL